MKKKTEEQFQEELKNLTGEEYSTLELYQGRDKKILFRHNTCGTEFLLRPDKFFGRGQRCPKCSLKTNMKSTEQFKEDIGKLVGEEYTVLGEYTGTDNKILFKHNVCGYEYETTPHTFLKGYRCPNCAGNVKKTLEDVKKEVFDIYGDEYEILGDYKGNNASLKVKHKPCGFIYQSRRAALLNHTGQCPVCGYNVKQTLNSCRARIYRLVGDEYSILSQDYINVQTPIEMKHNKCGHIFLMSPDHFYMGQRCPKCSGCMDISPEQFRQEVKELVGNEYTLLEDYKNAYSYIKIRHNVCGTEYLTKRGRFVYQGYRCPKCQSSKHFSDGEIEMSSFIKEVVGKENVIENDKKMLQGKEIDVYIPKQKIGFEYDGLYYHSELFKEDNYHLDKTLFCKEKEIRLIHVFEDEWINSKEIVKDKIKNILQVGNNKKIYARNCKIKEVSNFDRQQFFMNNHIQGADSASAICIGLYNKEELVATISLCKPRINMGGKNKEDGTYELSRYATLLNTSVVGGFSKLLKYVLQNYCVKSVYTYADLRWSSFENNMYDKNGFKLVGQSRPNYFYSKNGQLRENRFKYRKSEIKKKFPNIYSNDKTEREMMKEIGYHRIYDCGTLKYELVNPYYKGENNEKD